MTEGLYPVAVVLAFNAVDIVSGVIAGVKESGIKSAKLRDGLFKKCGFLLCYALAFLIDTYGGYVGIDIGVKILPPILLYVCSTETVSIIENIGRINPALLPEKMLNLFHIEKDRRE